MRSSKVASRSLALRKTSKSFPKSLIYAVTARKTNEGVFVDDEESVYLGPGRPRPAEELLLIS